MRDEIEKAIKRWVEWKLWSRKARKRFSRYKMPTEAGPACTQGPSNG